MRIDVKYVPKEPVLAVETVLKYGIKKGYKPYGWKHFKKDYKAALKRHVASYLSGTTIDEESGLPTLSHILANAMFLYCKELQDDADGK